MPNPVQETCHADSAHVRAFIAPAAAAAAAFGIAAPAFAMGQRFDGLGEYVIDWGPGHRLYMAKDGEALIVLFGGGTKRGQQRDIDRAKALFAEYKARRKVLTRKAGSGKGKR